MLPDDARDASAADTAGGQVAGGQDHVARGGGQSRTGHRQFAILLIGQQTTTNNPRANAPGRNERACCGLHLLRRIKRAMIRTDSGLSGVRSCAVSPSGNVHTLQLAPFRTTIDVTW
jgi:hypothetical protein